MIKSFKIVAFVEGVSLLLLFFFAMPMKYAFDRPEFVRVIGMAHGLLFIGYVIMAAMLKFEEKWDNKKFALICLASVVPFGTFYIERKCLRDPQAKF
jgi:integral membrane protein